MRLHRLEIQAFGPFAGNETVDFDALAAQGLFLLNGATGAGKTSVLDAIAYALYGQIPGARQSSIKTLHSHHAPADLAPVVVCEFSVGARRLEVRRSPEWMRPAKRGSGNTKQQASTQLRELKAHGWETLSQRNDEAASEIQQLLGMTMAQFTKVILLAQGDFAAFLQANAKDREDLLEKLFGTQIYQDLEARLAVEAKDATALVASFTAQLSTLTELATGHASQILKDPSEEVLALDGTELLDHLESELCEGQSARVHSLATANQKVASHRGALELAQDKLDRHTRYLQLTAESEHLAALAPEARSWRESLAADLHAQVLAPRLQHAVSTDQAFTAAKIVTTKNFRALDVDLPIQSILRIDATAHSSNAADFEFSASQAASTLSIFERVNQSIVKQLAQCEAALPLSEKLSLTTAQMHQVQQQIGTNQTELLSQQTKQTRGQARKLEISNELVLVRQTATALTQATEQEHQAAEVLKAVKLFDTQQSKVAQLSLVEIASRDSYLSAKEQWLAAIESRLLLAAGELASHLIMGQPCQVCGSVKHPQPSKLLGSSAESVIAEKKAKELQHLAETKLEVAANALTEATNRLSLLEGQGGATELKTALATSARAKRVLIEAQDSTRLIEALTAELADLAQDEVRSQQDITQATVNIAGLDMKRNSLELEIQNFRSVLEEARGTYENVAQRTAELLSSQSINEAFIASIQALNSRSIAKSEAHQELVQALNESPFGNETLAQNALLTPEERLGLQNRLSIFDSQAAVNKSRLDSPDTISARHEAEAGYVPATTDELAQLQLAVRQSQESAHEAAADVVAVSKVRQLLAQTAARYQKLAGDCLPLREQAELLTGLSEAVRGGSGNLLNMTLSSYVLAARLEQVAMAASLRLITMSGGRYTLSHSDARAGRNRKSGLGLEVVDEWTQVSRDTSTLSGGESFMASLALALGLADVVQHESGGLDIETLFVDEGFGSLDEESLEQVMDALENLRDGGRVVGLVSHVAEMKSRIPVHLQVTKGRIGSTLSLREM